MAQLSGMFIYPVVHLSGVHCSNNMHICMSNIYICMSNIYIYIYGIVRV